MARETFKAGKVTIESNDLSHTKDMSLSCNGEEVDLRAIGQTNPIPDPLSENWEISFTCDYDPDDSAQAALRNKYMGGSRTLTSVYYYEDGSHYVTGSAMISTLTLTKSVGNVDQLQCSIKSRGDWSYT